MRGGNNQVERSLEFLQQMAAQGGPSHEEYGLLSDTFQLIGRLAIPYEKIRERLKPTLATTNCMQGLGFLKPHGYAGDFEMIDRIYTYWVSSDPQLRRWDEYFHSHSAPCAVRNRKAYFHQMLNHCSVRRNGHEVWVLNLGSGPARDVYEYMCKSERLNFHCVDMDHKAIRYAQEVCKEYLHRVEFSEQNILRMKCIRKYDLIWSSGLFDYFSDRLFKVALKRLLALVRQGGEIVIGNFSETNPSRVYMEAVGDWKLEYRSANNLMDMAQAVGIPKSNIYVDSEPEGVNLFLHIAK